MYGKGLVGLFNEDGKMTHQAWRQARVRPSYNSQPIFGLGTIDAEGAKAWFYGLAKGIQYKGVESTRGADASESPQSNCFYAIYGLVDTADLLKYDFQNIMQEGSFNWFNVAGYDPLHLVGDLTVSYQYCGGTTQLNNLTSLMSQDYAYIAQLATNQVSYLATEWSNVAKKFADAQYENAKTIVSENCPDKNAETKQCEEWEDCFQEQQEFDFEEFDPKSCVPEGSEEALDAMVTNMWETGQIWGDVMANMFGATLQA